MTQKLNEIHITLEKMRQDLTVNIERSNSDGYSGGEASKITIDIERQFALKNQMEKSLVLIERALQKIDAGTYGICDKCGKPIDPARMEALPHSIFCWLCSSTCKK
jgi:RNA polymerase-binding transcription factor DksA